MILNNVELHWARLGSTVDQGFDGNSPAWTANCRTRDKEQADAWREFGLNVKTQDDDEGLFWSVSVKKPQLKKDGSVNVPPPVVGKDKMPMAIDKVDSIGNGTVANVKIRDFDYEYNGRKGRGFRLDAVQITEFVEYEGGKSPVDYFEAL